MTRSLRFVRHLPIGGDVTVTPEGSLAMCDPAQIAKASLEIVEPVTSDAFRAVLEQVPGWPP